MEKIMQIVLNDKLVEQEKSRLQKVYLESVIYEHTKTQHEYGKKKFEHVQGIIESKLRNHNFIGLLSKAYSEHLKIAISPYDIWIVLLSELSKEVATNPDTYRNLFTDSKEKKEITVLSASLVEMPVDSLVEHLHHLVKFDSSIMFPTFSFNDEKAVETINAIFCDMASPFYDYSMFCCGIPAIKLLGTREDWEKIQLHWDSKIKSLFVNVNPSIEKYFDRVAVIIGNIINSYELDFSDWWKDIYTQKNIGSGGELEVNGWIKLLFLKQHKYEVKLENFTNTYGIVQYKQLDTDKNYVAVYGGFDYEKDEDGFVRLVYDKIIYEKLPEQSKAKPENVDDLSGDELAALLKVEVESGARLTVGGWSIEEGEVWSNYTPLISKKII